MRMVNPKIGAGTEWIWRSTIDAEYPGGFIGQFSPATRALERSISLLQDWACAELFEIEKLSYLAAGVLHRQPLKPLAVGRFMLQT